MIQQQCPEDHQSSQIKTNSLINRNVKYTTTNQFYPKSKLKTKPKQSHEIEKYNRLQQVSKSSFCQKHEQTTVQTLFTPQVAQVVHEQSKKKIPHNNHSFTMKIIDHHIHSKQSNLIGKNVKNKVYSKLYEQIYQINYKQQKIGTNHVQNTPQRLKSNLKNMPKIKNLQSENNNQLYKSLPQPFINKKLLNTFDHPELSSNYFKSRVNTTLIQKKKYSQRITEQLKMLQINGARQKQRDSINDMIDQLTKINNNVNSIMQSTIHKKNRYKKRKLEPLNANNFRQKMSNNIRDYLSVQKIRIKQIEDHLLSQTSNTINQRPTEREPIFDLSLAQPRKTPSQRQRKQYKSMGPSVSIQTRIKIQKFIPPFDLYYYRDFLWKVGFSNEMIVESPPDYQTKIKVFLGKGNNSNLIRGLIKRRPWYQITEKYQQAHFVWTQIKLQPYFSLQRKSINKIQSHALDSPLIDVKKSSQTIQIINDFEKIKFSAYWTKNMSKQMKFKENLKNRSKMLNLKEHSVQSIATTMKIHNHFRNNYVIGNKKALFSLMNKHYTDNGEDVFNYLPLTFHIKNGLEDDQYLKFLQYFYSISKEIKKLQTIQLKSYIYKHNAWIVKPGENTNRGNGIIVCLNLNQVKAILKTKQKHNDGTYKTYILQKYIEKPLLYKRRKFDLRHYMLMSSSNGIVKGYWYKEGYVRTTSAQYTLKFNSGGVHLTNDAVQKQLPDYGKYQKGNKISYQELNDFIKKSDPEFDFQRIIFHKMKKIAADLIKASAKLMEPQRRENNFQIFGLDFMIDEAYNVWLIECNSNPCLQLSCPLLGKIIPRMVQNSLRICIDSIFVPPLNFSPKCQEYYQNVNEQNLFQLVYDQRTDIEDIKVENNELLQNKQFQQDDDTFDDDGEAWDD